METGNRCKMNVIMEDGSRLVTEQPQIDEVLAVIEACGTRCENIGIITE
jgi:hypothetical protein